PLVGFYRLNSRAPQRAGMQIDVAAAIVGHHKTKALLIVEELDLAFDHGTGGTTVAVMLAATAPEAVAPAAALAARTAAWRLRGGGVDAMHADRLQTTGAVRQVADNRRARRHIAMAGRLQGAGVTKGVAAIVQCDETVPLGGVKPLHLALRRGLRNG